MAELAEADNIIELRMKEVRLAFIVSLGSYGLHFAPWPACTAEKYALSNNFGGSHICVPCVAPYTGLKKCIVFCPSVSMSCCDIKAFNCLVPPI